MFSHKLTPDTELRLLEPRHAADVYALVDLNREHLGRWLSWVGDRRSAEDLAAYIKQALHRFAEDGSPYCGIWRQGTLAGTIDLMGTGGRHRCAEIGYWLDAAHEGQGLVTLACRALVDHAFDKLNVNRVEIRTEPANTRSCAVAQRLGFAEEGTLRQVIYLGMRFADRSVYAMLRDEWANQRTKITFAYPLAPDVELRLLQPSDAQELFALADANRERLRPYMSWIEGTTEVAHISGFIRHAIQRMADQTEYHWGIWYQGQIAGVIGTLPINWPSRKVEFGYWLGEQFQGKGLMTMACHALLAYLFNDLDLNRAEIRLNAINAPSRGVAKRLGFSYECTQRQAYRCEDKPADIECYALLREEWEAQQCQA